MSISYIYRGLFPFEPNGNFPREKNTSNSKPNKGARHTPKKRRKK